MRSKSAPTVTADNTVLVVGAGICGLATALSLAKQGHHVHVLESRAHPRDAHSIDALARSGWLIKQANRAHALGEQAEASRLFDDAHETCRGVWGQRHRNLLFDHHAVEFFRALGADCERLPTLTGFDTHLGANQPSICIRYGARATANGSGRLDAATIIAQRDPVSAPAISDVEQMLLAAAKGNPRIRISFAMPVCALDQTEHSVTVRCSDDDNSVHHGALVVLADGGGRRSISRQLGIRRVEVAREAMNIAAFQCDPAARLLGHSLADAWLVARTTRNGWVVFLCSGDGLLTVNTRRVVGAHAPTAVDLARGEGVVGTLLEAPADFEYPLDRATQFVSGRRVVLVGDAACRASPIWAFGAQFGLLWAQMVADLCANGSDTAALAAFATEAERISKMRLEFESSVIELVDFTNAGVREVSEIAMSANLFAALDEVDLHFRARGPTGGGLDLRLGINLDALIGASDKPDLAAFCGAVGRLDVDGAMALSFDAGQDGAALASTERPMRYRTELEDIRLQEGDMAIGRDPAGFWSVRISGAHLQRLVASSGSNTRSNLEHAQLRLPDAFVTDLLKQMGPRLWALGAIRQRPLQIDMALAPGRMQLGGFALQLRGRPLARITMRRQAQCSHFTFELRRGTASVVDFARFVRGSGLRVTQPLRSSQRLLGPLADSFINIWATGASHLVRKVDFKINAKGTGTAVYYVVGIAVPIPMSADDVQQLIDELFNSRSCAQIMRHYQSSLLAADVASVGKAC